MKKLILLLCLLPTVCSAICLPADEEESVITLMTLGRGFYGHMSRMEAAGCLASLAPAISESSIKSLAISLKEETTGVVELPIVRALFKLPVWDGRVERAVGNFLVKGGLYQGNAVLAALEAFEKGRTITPSMENYIFKAIKYKKWTTAQDIHQERFAKLLLNNKIRPAKLARKMFLAHLTFDDIGREAFVVFAEYLLQHNIKPKWLIQDLIANVYFFDSREYEEKQLNILIDLKPRNMRRYYRQLLLYHFSENPDFKLKTAQVLTNLRQSIWMKRKIKEAFRIELNRTTDPELKEFLNQYLLSVGTRN